MDIDATWNDAHQSAEQLLIRSPAQQKVKHIFGIQGGKIMPTFDVLIYEGPRLIVCRHEQTLRSWLPLGGV